MRWAVRVIVVLAGGVFVIGGLADPAGPPSTPHLDAASLDVERPAATALPDRSAPAASRSGRTPLPTPSPTDASEPTANPETPSADGGATPSPTATSSTPPTTRADDDAPSAGVQGSGGSESGESGSPGSGSGGSGSGGSGTGGSGGSASGSSGSGGSGGSEGSRSARSGGTSSSGSGVSTASERSEPTFEDAIVDASNAARQDDGVAHLARSTCADDAAAERAAALVGTGRLEHAPLGPLMSDCGARSAGENLVLASPDAEQMVRLWLDSPGHRANLLSDGFTHIGVGCADDGRQRICAQVFLGLR